jgi:hypothetical protein
VGEDADVAWVLTTNRPDVLEPALAARPGRVELAVELPLPDEDARRRLLDLYARGLDLRLADVDTVVRRTAGVPASFVKDCSARRRSRPPSRAGRRSRTPTSHASSTSCSTRPRCSHACCSAPQSPAPAASPHPHAWLEHMASGEAP